jgi:hypothetical protein
MVPCDSVPSVADRRFHVLPRRLAAILIRIPVPLQLRLNFRPVATLIPVRRFISVAVSGLVVRIIVRTCIRPCSIRIPPVGILCIPVGRRCAFAHQMILLIRVPTRSLQLAGRLRKRSSLCSSRFMSRNDWDPERVAEVLQLSDAVGGLARAAHKLQDVGDRSTPSVST